MPNDIEIEANDEDDVDEIQQQLDQIHMAKLQPGRITASHRKLSDLAAKKDHNGPTEETVRRHSPVKGQGRIVTENENKLRLAIQENEALQKLYEQKQIEQ